MDIRWMIAMCAGGGALVGAALGDLAGASHYVVMMMAGIGGGIGAGIGINIAVREVTM
jgi:hypothetical protein